MASNSIETPERAPGTVDPVAGLGSVMAQQSFEDGGDVPDALDQTSDMGEQVNPISDRVNRALALVNQALMYGYQKHGLSQGEGASDPSEDPGMIPDPEEQSFEDGGVVEGEEEDPANSSLVPEQEPMPADAGQAAADQQSQGMIPDQAEAPQDRPLEKAGLAPHQLLQRGAAALMAMIKGADAAPQEAIDKARGVVDAEHPNHPGASNLSAAEVLANGNPEKMWSVLQLNRKKFDAAKAFAANALDQQNLPSAADAATKAYHHILDGTDVKFTPTQQGVMVAIKPLNSHETQQNLTVPQFRQWLMGRPGQYDNVLATGGQASIQQAAQSAPDAGQVQQRTQQRAQPQRAGAAPPPGTLRGFDGQGQVSGSSGDPQQVGAKVGTEGGLNGASLQDVLKEIDRAYPTMNTTKERALARAAARQHWADNHTKIETEQTKNTRAENVAKIGASARQGVAETNAGARREVEGVRQAGAGARNTRTNDTRETVAREREGGVEGRFQRGEQGRNDRTIMQNKPGVIGNENKMNEARKSLGPAQQAPHQPQPQRQQAPALPPEAVRALSEGKHTTFKNGQTWTLQGGRPVQVQ